MVDLQELIVRGRMIFEGADKRFEVFELIQGRRSTIEIARKTGRALSAVDRDIEKLRDIELVREKTDGKGNIVKVDGSIVYEKTPLIRHVPIAYFRSVADTSKLVRKASTEKGRASRIAAVHVPSETEILDICRHGEDQLYEFKAPGVAADKVTKEVAGFLHTKRGGLILYGVNDDGSIIGADMRRQDFDQKIQNSVRNTISPAPSIEIKERKVLGCNVLLVVVPPWDKKTIYQYTMDGRYYIRRGTNIFAVEPDEIRKLSQGVSVV
jgi:hypothetical protein